jgi:uncharacterized protein (DUF2267 family)
MKAGIRMSKMTSRDAFLERIRDAVKHDNAVDAEQRAVLALLARRLPAVELEDAKAATPPPIHGLWPAQPRRGLTR